MRTQSLLIELLVEELPPKALARLSSAFAQTLTQELIRQGLAQAEVQPNAFATPRRLAVRIPEVSEQAADREVSHKLMPVSVGIDAQGQPTPALTKKLAALGAPEVAVSQLQRRPDGKSQTLYLDRLVPGVALQEGVAQALETTIAQLPIPKVMSYQLDDGWTSVKFVRPAHGLVALWGDQVLDVGVLGLRSGRHTQGHRFESLVQPVVLEHADRYEDQMLQQGRVIVDLALRRKSIQDQLSAQAGVWGLQPVDDAALLDEVTALVERPVVYACEFDPEFLSVPQECLILTMKANQKYFPLLDTQGRLTHRFLVVSHIAPADPTRVIQGNERVVRPRLADARFFYDQDKKRTLASRVAGLSQVVYHGKLGTQADRMQRVRQIARVLATELGHVLLVQQCEQAAELAKADLLTDMVGEFPELQGVMGAYYARHDGVDDDVAQAIEDHYRPRFAGDELPRGQVGCILALADKMETLAGLFGIGQTPTGEKDPFALRRHALGVARLLVERQMPLPMNALMAAAFGAFPPQLGQAQAALAEFMTERLMGYLKERGYAASEVDAVVSVSDLPWSQILDRLRAVRAFAALPEATSLASANKRVANILKKAAFMSEEPVRPERFVQEPERQLHAALLLATPLAERAYAKADFIAALSALAVIKQPVDAFFEAVMVNADDESLRVNRLALLRDLHRAMNRVADLSRLAA